jgi:parvulin-like peptidyl-prolyl isomerase
MKITIYTVVSSFFVFTLLLINCTKESQIKEQVVASAGDRLIDWKLLKRSFHLNPKWGRGLTNREAYQNQLNYLIEQKQLAQEAIARGLNNDELLESRLKFIKEKEMIKELYRREVASKVEITEQEYQQAYVRSKISVQFEFIYTPNLNNARAYLQQLKSTPVAKITLIDPAVEQKGTSPMFGFGDMAAEIEEVVFDMAPGELKGPIEVNNKYMVVKLVEGMKEKFVSETDFAENKNKIRQVLFERRARKISDEYIYNMLHNNEMSINPETFFPLAEHFSRYVRNKNSDKPFPSTKSG